MPNYYHLDPAVFDKKFLVYYTVKKGKNKMDNSLAIKVSSAEGAFRELWQHYVHRVGANDLLEWMYDNGFFEMPASINHHDNFTGGLVYHSMRVYFNLIVLAERYNITDSMETLLIVSLLHDLCKIDDYEYATGGWTWTERDDIFGHGSQSVYLASQFINLSKREMEAIRFHMGLFEPQDSKIIGKIYENNSLAWILHVADEAATYITEE